MRKTAAKKPYYKKLLKKKKAPNCDSRARENENCHQQKWRTPYRHELKTMKTTQKKKTPDKMTTTTQKS
jgi:hypothetical protein